MPNLLQARANDHFRTGDRERLNEWLTSIGLDTTAITAVLIVKASNGYALHVTEKVRNDRGREVIDQALNAVVTRPRVIYLGHEKTWPDIVTWPNGDRAGKWIASADIYCGEMVELLDDGTAHPVRAIS